jgi:hypothetical protein
VVLNHGFARSKETQYNNALYMAQRGIVVLTPNQVSLLTGKQGQLRNIANTVDHVQWLNDRTADPSDPLAGQIDSNRIGLAGHSAGGRSLSRRRSICRTLAKPRPHWCCWTRCRGTAPSPARASWCSYR